MWGRTVTQGAAPGTGVFSAAKRLSQPEFNARFAGPFSTPPKNQQYSVSALHAYKGSLGNSIFLIIITELRLRFMLHYHTL
jgi:hypothetical protein